MILNVFKQRQNKCILKQTIEYKFNRSLYQFDIISRQSKNIIHKNYTKEQQYCSYHVIIQKYNNRGNFILRDFNAAVNEEMLNEKEVKTIITAALGFQHLKINNNIPHIVFPLSDIKSQNIYVYFEESYQIIEENLKKGGVLVHCGAGIS